MKRSFAGLAVALVAAISAVSAVSAGTPTVAASAKSIVKRIYLANDDHTDYMWSADADTYDRVFVEQLDFNLRLIERTRRNASPYRHRYNTDGSYWLWQYERQKPAADFERLMARVKDGSLTVPMNTLVSTYGGQPLEAVLRGLYYAGRLERRFDLRFQLATATENQTLPRGLASLFAGAGARYSFRGVCACASHIPLAQLKQRPQEIYWATGPDGQRQLMKWYSVGPHNVGTYWEAGEPEAALRWTASDAGFKARQRDPQTGQRYRVLGLFGFGGDDLARKTGQPPPPEIPGVPGLQKVPSSPFVEHFHTLARRLSTPQRQLIVSNELDFFQDFERQHGAGLPSLSLSYGNEWDLYPASMAETTARVKRAVEQLRSAELLASLVSLKFPAFMDRHRRARDEAYTALGLYWEHNWTADGPITRGQRAAWQNKLAATLEYYVQSLQSEGLIRLGGMIPRPVVDGRRANRFFVLNPLGWARSEPADHFHDGEAPVHVLDLSTGQPVPHQRVLLAGRPHLRILAPDVPATGYKVFEIRPGLHSASAALAPAATAEPEQADGSRVFESAQLRLVVARDGAITSLRERRQADTEWVAAHQGLAVNDLAADRDDGEPLRVDNAGPVSVTLVARSEAGLPHRSRITLYAHSPRIDIDNQIDANFGGTPHWAFSFKIAQPQVHSEEVGAINLNRRAADGGHYADSHARYDYVTLNHFAHLSEAAAGREPGPGITLSSPDLSFVRLGNSRPDSLDTQTPQLQVLAGGQVDGPGLGIPRQNGATQFLQRFALQLQTGSGTPQAMRMALEHQNPLIAAPVLGRPEGQYPETRFQLLQLDGDGVMLWALKPADDGIEHGLVLRLWNLREQAAEASLALTGGLRGVIASSHVETPLPGRSLEATPTGRYRSLLQAQQLQTLRLQLPAAARTP